VKWIWGFLLYNKAFFACKYYGKLGCFSLCFKYFCILEGIFYLAIAALKILKKFLKSVSLALKSSGKAVFVKKSKARH